MAFECEDQKNRKPPVTLEDEYFSKVSRHGKRNYIASMTNGKIVVVIQGWIT